MRRDEMRRTDDKKRHSRRERDEKKNEKKEKSDDSDRKKLFLQRTQFFSHPTGTFFFLPYSFYNVETSALGRFNAVSKLCYAS